MKEIKAITVTTIFTKASSLSASQPRRSVNDDPCAVKCSTLQSANVNSGSLGIVAPLRGFRNFIKDDAKGQTYFCTRRHKLTAAGTAIPHELDPRLSRSRSAIGARSSCGKLEREPPMSHSSMRRRTGKAPTIDLKSVTRLGVIEDDTKALQDHAQVQGAGLRSRRSREDNSLAAKPTQGSRNCQHRFHCCSTVEGSW